MGGFDQGGPPKGKFGEKGAFGKGEGKDHKGGKDGEGKGDGKDHKGGAKGLLSSNYGVRGTHFRRKALDLNAGVVRFLETWNLAGCSSSLVNRLTPHTSGAREMLLPHLMPSSDTLKGVAGICSRQAVVCYNKSKTAATAVAWAPSGRRMCLGNHNGEISLWNTGHACNFEIVQQSHTGSLRFVKYAFSGQLDEILFTGDQAGVLKLWDKNFCNTVRLTPHDNVAMRDLAVAPGLEKFCTCGDEPTVKIWDFRTLKAERTLLGHGYDVRALDWHPVKALIATGSKDNQLKLYDPRQETAIVTLYHHKNSIAKMKFQPNGMSLASGGKDQLIHILDIRTMKIKKSLKGHNREVTTIAWHPKYDNVISSGGFDPAIYHWDLYNSVNYRDDAGIVHPQQVVRLGHEGGTTCLEYHPLGTALASCGRDGNAKIWVRLRPGETAVEDATEALIRMNQERHESGKGKKGGKKGGITWSTQNINPDAAFANKDDENRPKAKRTIITDSVLLTKDTLSAVPTIAGMLASTDPAADHFKSGGGAANPFDEIDNDLELADFNQISSKAPPAVPKTTSAALTSKASSISTAGVKEEHDGENPPTTTTGKDATASGVVKRESPHSSPRPPLSGANAAMVYSGKGGKYGGKYTPVDPDFVPVNSAMEPGDSVSYRALKNVNQTRSAVPLLHGMGVFSDSKMLNLSTNACSTLMEKIKSNQRELASRKRDFATAFPTLDEMSATLGRKKTPRR
ncbi:unnamed protein product [Amoebophrya sp. A25]|nr:unnamed protein product [Amoebophrya sp. A25]|eukprot:GSA25T00001640001.1